MYFEIENEFIEVVSMMFWCLEGKMKDLDLHEQNYVPNYQSCNFLATK
jgi:hypothetical protein